jgi:hypothetical protein
MNNKKAPKKQVKKLVLSKETLRSLSVKEQQKPAGAAENLFSPCRACLTTI